MAVISKTTICNSALVKLGAERISSVDDETKRARLCKEQYEKVRNDLLMSHPWNFAIARKDLSLSATFTPKYEYTNAFAIPSDCMRVIDTSLNYGAQIGEKHWNVEIDPDTHIKYLVCNDTAVQIRYLKDVDEVYFTPAFAEVLAMKLAVDLSYSITQSASLSQLLNAQYEAKLREVRSFDAQEGSVRTVDADDWLLARLAGGPGFFID